METHWTSGSPNVPTRLSAALFASENTGRAQRVVAAILLTRSIPVPFVSMRRFNGLGMRRLKVFYVTKGK